MRSLPALLALASAALAGADAGNPFAYELFARLAAREGNVVCSPLSVRVALAMAYGGARGTTAEEMAKTLGCDATVHAAMAAIAAEYDGKDGMPALANAAWVQRGAALLPAYADLVASYGAPPRTIDFGDALAAARAINEWAFARTRERINEIVHPDMFDANTALVLANALHFRAAWQHRFRARVTKERPFTLASGEQANIPFMAQTEHLRYAERDGAAAVELPYEGGRFSMVVALPAGGSTEFPTGLLDSLEGAPVTVFLPRFRIEAGYRLEEALQAMGMKAAFTGDADFSGINGKNDLFVSVVAHKAFIDVNEEGTEAAAATAVAMELKGDPGAPKVFRADRPFLFLIRDLESGAILFMGRVADPRG